MVLSGKNHYTTHMESTVIQNIKDLTTYSNRQDALSIMEAGLDAIYTEKVVTSSVSVHDDVLQVKTLKIDLHTFKRIRVIGFGKASCEAAIALEKVLGSKIKEGVIIDIKTTKCEFITSLEGVHPRPALQNVAATKQLLDVMKELTEDDLVLVIISGGGSALLCWPEKECTQGEALYRDFLTFGGKIDELNTVRKHLSSLKGGGLAKFLYPATVVGLIFCDVPGNALNKVASGPTIRDSSTVADAQAILDKYNLKGFTLNETPKDDRYFKNVHNISLVSNLDALHAMAAKATALGYDANIISSEIYDTPEVALDNLKKAARPKSVMLGGGEIKLIAKDDCGLGGRCSYLALHALSRIEHNDTFVAFASDGIDNSTAAGAIADASTLQKMRAQNLDPDDYIPRCDSYTFFEKTDDLIRTGPTGANVSDLMLWMRQ